MRSPHALLLIVLISACKDPDVQLLQAVSTVDVAEAKKALDRGANPNLRGPSKCPLLLLAIDKRNSEIARMLINKGADVNARDQAKRTVLSQAATNQLREVIIDAVAKGAIVNGTDDMKRTALHIAAQQGDLELVALLLKRGADPNLQDFQGNTALMFASGKDHPKVTRELLAVTGIDVDLATKTGRNAESVARGMSKAAIREYLAARKRKQEGSKEVAKLNDEIKKAKPGETIVLPDGKHNVDGANSLIIDGKEDLTIRGNKGKAFLLSKDPESEIIVVKNSKKITIDGLSVYHDVEVSCIAACITITDSSTVTVENCDIHGSGAYGVAGWGDGNENITVVDNVIHDCSYWGIELHAKGGKIEGNRFYNNGEGRNDIDPGSDKSITIKNNTHEGSKGIDP